MMTPPHIPARLFLGLGLLLFGPAVPEAVEEVAECENRLKAIGQALHKFVEAKGEGKYYPDELVDLAKEKLVDPRKGLTCPGDPNPGKIGEFLVGYQSAFDIVQEKIDLNLPALRPLVWDKAGNHEGLNLILLANGEILKIRDENDFREFIGGWETRRYLDLSRMDRIPTATLLQKLREEAEDINSDEVIRTVAARGPKILLELFRDLSWSVPAQRQILTSIVRLMGSSVEAPLVQDLNSRDIVARERAIELLALLGSRAADERFIKVLDSKVESAQLLAIEALTILKAKTALPALVRLAGSQAGIASRTAAIEALGRLGGQEVKSVLQPLLSNADIRVRIAAAKSLARLKDASVLPVLQKLALEAKDAQRLDVLAGFAALASPEAIKRLQNELHIQNEPRVLAAIKTVREEKVVELVPDLLPFLESGPVAVRMAAARTLGDLGDRSALSTLYKGLETNAQNLDLAFIIQVSIDQLEENGLLQVEEESLPVGATLVVASDQAPLYQGNQLLLNLKQGQAVTVRDKKGKWYGVQLAVSGQEVLGWMEEASLQKSGSDIAVPGLAATRADETHVMDGDKMVGKLPAAWPLLLAEERQPTYRIVTILGSRRIAGWVKGSDVVALPQPSEPPPAPPLQLLHALGLPRYTDAGLTSIAVSSHGKWFAAASPSGRIDVWETRTGERAAEQRENRPVLMVAFHARTHHLLVSTDREVKEFELGEKFNLVGTFPWKTPDLDATWVLPEQERGVYAVMETVKGESRWRLNIEKYKGVKKPAGKAPPRRPIGDAVPDFVEGELRPSGSSVKLLQKPDKEVPGPPSGSDLPPGAGTGQGPGAAGDLPPDAQARLDKESETADAKMGIELWDGSAKLPQGVRPVHGVAVSPNGFYAVALRPSKCDFVDLLQYQVVGSFETGARGVSSAAFFPTGRTLATGGIDGLVRLWDTSTLKLRRVLDPHGGKVLAMAVSPKEQFLALSSATGGLQVWDLFSLQMLQRLPHKGTATVLQFSPDGEILIAGNMDNTVAVYGR
ncbi:MAG: HEAT repeat domain-containing protein [Planctomycetes bacterium]|nr:HEAT repeat domain-containing protein [Planctomycetota bacterium]